MPFSLLALSEYPYKKKKIPQRHIYLIAEGHDK
jgi:hypothetical protein